MTFFFDLRNSFGEATNLDSFLKAYKTSESKNFFPSERFDHPDKMQNTEIDPYDALYEKLRSCNDFQIEFPDYIDRLKSGMATEQTVIKLKVSKPPPTGTEHELLYALMKVGLRLNRARSKF